MLTTRPTQATEGTERKGSVDDQPFQRLSGVNPAPPQAGDRDAHQAQLSQRPTPELDNSPGRAANAVRMVSQIIKTHLPSISCLLIPDPTTRRREPLLPPQELPIQYSPSSPLDDMELPPDFPQLAIFKDAPPRIARGTHDRRLTTTPDRLRIRDRRSNPHKHIDDSTRGAEFFQLHNNSPDISQGASSPPRQLLGWHDTDRSRVFDSGRHEFFECQPNRGSCHDRPGSLQGRLRISS